MTCKVDNNKIFAEEQPYTQKCEACGFYVKFYSYRSCEARHQWNLEKGIDVFAPLAALDQMARSQLGLSTPSSSPNTKSSSNKTSRHRGRR